MSKENSMKDEVETSVRSAYHAEDVEDDIHGDNSDGHVDWTVRQVIALFSLSTLWVGK